MPRSALAENFQDRAERYKAGFECIDEALRRLVIVLQRVANEEDA